MFPLCCHPALVGVIAAHASLSSGADVVYVRARVGNLLLGHQLGVGTVELLLLWSALNLCKAATSTWVGQPADSLGRGALMLIGGQRFRSPS